MKSSFSTLTLLVGLITVAACAELPTKSVTLPTGETIDYVEVRDEPFHRHQFQDDRIRLYDVLIPAGKSALYHRHSEDTAYVVVQPSRFRNQTAGAPAIEVDLPPPGTAFFDTQSKTPVIHQVSNIGSVDGRLIGVELYQVDKTIAREPLSAPGLTLGQTAPQIRIYNVILEPGQTTGPLNTRFPHLLIAITDGALKAGDFIWSKEAKELTLTNDGAATFKAVLYELP